MYSTSEGLPDSNIERAKMLQNTISSRVTGGTFENELYSKIRLEFMGNSSTKKLLPEYVRLYRQESEIWDYFKRYANTWQERREHINKTFSDLLDYLESKDKAPADNQISGTLFSFSPDGVHASWEKAHERRHRDPEGAITSARTLIETVCKHILEEAGEEYKQGEDLPKLYSMTAEVLNLAPSQHTEPVFKSILGSCQKIVNDLGTLRNRIGDAHGQGKLPIKPSPRHAALAVNLAGAMATFLVETWEIQKLKSR